MASVEQQAPDGAAVNGNANGSAGSIPVENPATGETIATVPDLGASRSRPWSPRARARAARLGGARLRGSRRGPARARGWMVANAERVVDTICAETGKTRRRDASSPSSPTALSALEFWAKKAPKYLADEEIESASPFVRGRKMVVRYAPARRGRRDRARGTTR